MDPGPSAGNGGYFVLHGHDHATEHEEAISVDSTGFSFLVVDAYSLNVVSVLYITVTNMRRYYFKM